MSVNTSISYVLYIIMSFFYLTAVKGDIPVHLLETIALERLRYLKQILNANELFYSEYLVEGGIYDNVGHFLLCVVTILLKNIDLKRFILKTEKDLFKLRIYALDAYDLRSFAKRLVKTIKKQQHTPEFIEPLRILCEHLMLKDLAQHVCAVSHRDDCVVHSICLNFKHCLLFVAKRQVELKNGVAYIPCGKWKQYLTNLFYVNFSHRLTSSNVETLKTDPRISELLSKLDKEIKPLINYNNNRDILHSTKVDVESNKFPPCMLNLHQELRKRHRLSHTQRFYYSLFLKDIEMPVEEAVDFWRFEYRQTPNGSHSCCHNWERDEKKYLYGIRHMYGLEGGRKTYNSATCQRIQSVESSCAEGGCPFKIFEPTKMLHILNLESTDPIWSQILELKSKHCYTSACMKYLHRKHVAQVPNCDIENASFNFTPVKYYTNASKR